VRLAHHLKRLPTGVYYFRLTVPESFRAVYGCREIKQSLRTRDPVQAKAIAYRLSAHYANEFAQRREQGMGWDWKPEDDKLRTRIVGGHALPKSDAQRLAELRRLFPNINWDNVHDFRMDKLPNGLPYIAEAQPGKDMDDAQWALKQAMEAAKQAPVVAPPAPSYLLPQTVLKLSEGIRRFVNSLQGEAAADTIETKQAYMVEFKDWKNDVEVHTVTRTDLAEFNAYLKEKGNELPTRKNKFSYLGQFFDFVTAGGYYPAALANPAKGHVRFGAKQRRAREKYGSEEFLLSQLPTIFEPERFKKFKQPAEYWVPLIQLYTGARVNEVSQLLLKDFTVEDGQDCVKITDEGDDQSIKGEGSERVVPLHPDLLALGLMDYVAMVRGAGYAELFPYLFNGKNKQGDRVQKGFARHLKKVGIKPRGVGRVGTHSLRKTCIQTLHDRKVAIDDRCKYVGHETNSIHINIYIKYPPKELADTVFPALYFGLDLEALKCDQQRFLLVIKQEVRKTQNGARQKAQAKRGEKKKVVVKA